MKIHRLFPSLIYQDRILPAQSELNHQLKKECYKFREIDKAGQKWCKENYPGGYTSYGSLANLHEISPYFDELRQKIDKGVGRYIKALDMDIKPKDLQMCSLWINIMPPGVTHTMHIHPLSVISGTYYLQFPENARGLKFEDPRMIGYMATVPRKKKARPENQWFIEMKPKVGEIILFESWIRHEVPPNPAKSERMSISFNYHWV